MRNRGLQIILLFIGFLIVFFVNAALFGVFVQVGDWYLVKYGFVNALLNFHQSFQCGMALTFATQAFALFIPRRFKWL